MSKIIARPYAKAIDLVAQDLAAKKSWDGFLKSLSNLIATKEIEQYFSVPSVSSSSKFNVIVEALNIKDKNFLSFVQCLVNNKRVFLAKYIYEIFHEMCMNSSVELVAVVRSPYALSNKEISNITMLLEKKFNCKISVDYKEDKSLIAGVTISVGDWVADASLNGYLSNLKAKLFG